jgi:Rod binding domain-containing protein
MPVSPVSPFSVPGSFAALSASRDVRSETPALTSQFEQLLVRQLLTQVRASGLSDGDQSSSAASYQAIADDHLARLVASVGGLGLGSVLSKTLAASTASPGALASPVLTKQAPNAVPTLIDTHFEK